jgi:hypothetical protein
MKTYIVTALACDGGNTAGNTGRRLDRILRFLLRPFIALLLNALNAD